MFTKTKLALAATLIIGSATLASAEGVSFDSYAPAPQQQTLTSRQVALAHKAPIASEEYINRASQVFDGGAN